jgi:hypothetical protein
MRGLLTRLLLLLALAGTALAGPAAALAGPAAAEPDPVINHATFNNPIGAPAEQNAIFIQLARLVDHVPAGEEIQLSWFGFDPPDTEVGKAPQARLAALLGTDDTRP